MSSGKATKDEETDPGASSSSLLGLFAPPPPSPPEPPAVGRTPPVGNDWPTDERARAVSSLNQTTETGGGDDDSLVIDENSSQRDVTGGDQAAAAVEDPSTPFLQSPLQTSSSDALHSSNAIPPPPRSNPPLQDHNDNINLNNNEQTPLLLHAREPSLSLRSLFDQSSSSPGGNRSIPSSPFVSSTEITPKVGTVTRKQHDAAHHTRDATAASDLPSIQEIPIKDGGDDGDGIGNFLKQPHHTRRQPFRSFSADNVRSALTHIGQELASPSTWIGSFMYLLFEVVYCLTMGAAITRSHSPTSILGLVSKMAALGCILAAPVFWLNLRDIPAIYPIVDLFSAPFLANVATIVDDALYQDPTVSDEDNDQVFFATFTFLASLSLFMSGTLLVLASVFKLANLGAFLPFPVLCGFFAAVGVLTWSLAFKIDANGLTVSQVFFSGDSQLILVSIGHHLPSVLVAAIMRHVGPKNPLYVMLVMLSTIGLFYVAMFAVGLSRDDMIDRHWFWSSDDLIYEPMHRPIGFTEWATPAPLGWINGFIHGRVHWPAVAQGFSTIVALSFMYLIRCSLHGAALKKNVPRLSRVERVDARSQATHQMKSTRQSIARLMNGKGHRRLFSEALDIEQASEASLGGNGDEDHIDKAEKVVFAKASNASLKDILLQYGLTQYVSCLVGSFAITPNVAASPTMFSLKAEKVAPQIGAVLLLSVFYLTNFKLVGYIPKPAFSSLLVLAFIDMIYNWFIKSYFKTKEKMEWLVVPLIVILAFAVGLLQSVFMGIGCSTFLFVGSFFRSGVVKYVANGMQIRSTIARSPKVGRWLDRNADKIQLLVLQNYLFFGNASSILSYVTSMFEKVDPDVVDPSLVPPCPQVIILDLTLVTGMDTSAVDAFADILVVCSNHECKLFLSGVPRQLRDVMNHTGFKPETTQDRSKRKLRFFPDLDAAIGKAEDLIMNMDEKFEEDTFDMHMSSHDGFRHALRQIDEQHRVSFSDDLYSLRENTQLLELEPGENIYIDRVLERGLFFIEHGILKIERSSAATLSRDGLSVGYLSQNGGTLNALNARTGSIGMALMQAKGRQHAARFRVARVGPGWVLGGMEALAGDVHPTGDIIAVTSCRLYYISFRTIEEIEEKNPLIVLKLYKLLAHLMGKRQEATISQLGTLHSIMSAPAQKKPISRKNTALAQLN